MRGRDSYTQGQLIHKGYTKDRLVYFEVCYVMSCGNIIADCEAENRTGSATHHQLSPQCRSLHDTLVLPPPPPAPTSNREEKQGGVTEVRGNTAHGASGTACCGPKLILPNQVSELQRLGPKLVNSFLS